MPTEKSEEKPAAKTKPGPSISLPKPPPKPLGPVAFVVKAIALAVGFCAALLCLMASIGAFTGNGYARVLGALAIVLIVPLVIADRLLPDDPLRAKGLTTDVLSVMWLGFGLIFAGALTEKTRPLLTREGDRLLGAGYVTWARAAYVLAQVKAAIPEPTPASLANAADTADAGAVGAADAAADAEMGADAASQAETQDAGAADAADAAAPNVPDAGESDAGAKGASLEKTPAELFKLLAPTVVTIFAKAGADMQGSGTGFMIDESGTIATNHHVIAGAQQLRIKFHNGAIFDSIELLVDDGALDLALLRIDPKKYSDAGPEPEFSAVKLGDSDKVVVGERAISIGNPLGLEHTLTDGLISSRRVYEGRHWIQMSVPVSPGNSGGPLFNMRGEVIGVTTAQIGSGFGRAQNLNLAVPVNELRKLIRSEYPQKRKFGESASSRW